MASRKKVLLFTDWYFPGYKAGGPIQSCKNLVSALRDDFLFYILTSDTDLGESLPYPDIISNKWYEGASGENIYYADNKKVNFSLIKNIISEVKPDVVYLNSMFSFKYTILPQIVFRVMGFKGKIVLAPRGNLRPGALSLKPAKKKIFLKWFKFFKLHQNIHFHATGPHEIKDILSIFPGSSVSMSENIPNLNISCSGTSFKEKGILKLIFISRIHPTKNLPFIFNIMREKKFEGKIVFDIYGEPESEIYLKKCIQMTKELPLNISVNFLGGGVNEEIVKRIVSYDAFLLPTLGENFGHVIFESLMSGVPVLISDQTPWRELSKSHAGWDIPLDQAEIFADKIQELLDMDSKIHRQWSLGARKLAENYLLQADFTNKYLELFNKEAKNAN